MGSGNSWEKRAYVHFDTGHEEAKAHLDTGCTFVIESATLRVHVSSNSRDFDGAFTSSCELRHILACGTYCCFLCTDLTIWKTKTPPGPWNADQLTGKNALSLERPLGTLKGLKPNKFYTIDVTVCVQ